MDSEVQWELDSITIEATLVRPPGAGPFAGAVMVALPEGVQNVIRALTAPVNQPLREATSALPQIDVPALIVIGKKDLQVNWRADGDPLQRTAGARQEVTLLSG
jgi:hypothetical protein